MKAELKEKREKAQALRDRLKEALDQAGDEVDMSKVKVFGDGLDSQAVVEKIRETNDELDGVMEEMEPLEASESEITRAKRAAEESGELKQHPGHVAASREVQQYQERQKSLGELFTETEEYKAAQKGDIGKVAELDVELKTLFQTTAGWAPENTRGPRVVDFITTPLDVVDLIPNTTTGQTSVVYMEETTFTNNAAEVAEGGTKPEAALALTEKESPVRKIAVWIPITDEQLEDVPQARGYINNRLPFMVRQRLNTQILNGNGTAPNLRGLLNTVGTLTQAAGTDPIPDRIYKAMTQVQLDGQAIPGGVVFNPEDWQNVRLLRTTDGIYIWGSPADAGPQRIWGLPVALAQGMPAGTALVGDFANFTELAVRKGIEMAISDSHSDFFVTNKQAIRAEMRAAIVVYRPQALCEVDVTVAP